jgi:uncharacterized membrane protein
MADKPGNASPTTSERTKVASGALAGLVAGGAVAWFVPWQFAVLVFWDVTVIVILAWTWFSVGGLDAAATAKVATREDESRRETRLLLLAAALASLVGVGLAVVKAKSQTGPLEWMLTTGGVVTVVLSWALVHTLYALRYARLYYSDHPGGIDFKSDEAPDYHDFAYVAFTVGMTFQVSDTDVQSRPIRRTVLRQALISYLFGTVIIALAINVLAGLVR